MKSYDTASKKGLKAIFFDAGGTLFRVHPSVGRVYARVAKSYGARVDSVKLEKIFRDEFNHRDGITSLGVHTTEKGEKLWWRCLVHDVFQKVGGVPRFDEFFEELYELFARPEVWRLYPEVKGMLGRLKGEGFVLGIVSNWDSRLLILTKRLGVEPYFDFVLASALVGSAKPNPGIFQEALKRACVSAEQAIHVGDSFKDDYRGASAAGIRSILLNRDGTRKIGIRVIRSLLELEQLIRSMDEKI